MTGGINPTFHKSTLSLTKKVRDEECYPLWCRPLWHVKVTTRIANHTVVSCLWVLPVTCLFAFFYPRQKKTSYKHTHKHTFRHRCGKRLSVCITRKVGEPKIYSFTPFILFTFTMSAFDTHKPGGMCPISMKKKTVKEYLRLCWLLHSCFLPH